MTDVSKVPGMMMAIEAAAYLNNSAKAIERLRELVPDFRPSETAEDRGALSTDWVEEEPIYSGAHQLDSSKDAPTIMDELTGIDGYKAVGTVHK